MDKRLKGLLGIVLIVSGIAIASLGGTPGNTESGLTDSDIFNMSFYVIGFFIAFLGFGSLLRAYRPKSQEHFPI
ncbi:MAG: hypothetical protein ACFFCQ_11285 [Promethearchaeota archaeon]